MQYVSEREPDSYNDVGDVRDVRRDQHQPHIDTYNLRQHDDGASNIQIREIRFLHHKDWDKGNKEYVDDGIEAP